MVLNKPLHGLGLFFKLTDYRFPGSEMGGMFIQISTDALDSVNNCFWTFLGVSYQLPAFFSTTYSQKYQQIFIVAWFPSICII